MDYPINIKEILNSKCLPVYGCCKLTSGYFASHGAGSGGEGGSITMDSTIITMDNDIITLDNQ